MTYTEDFREAPKVRAKEGRAVAFEVENAKTSSFFLLVESPISISAGRISTLRATPGSESRRDCQQDKGISESALSVNCSTASTR